MTTRFAKPTAVLAIALALLMLPISVGVAKALDGLNPSIDCQLTVKAPEGEEFAELAAEPLEVDIYRVASVDAEGAYVGAAGFEDIEFGEGVIEESDGARMERILSDAMAVVNQGDAQAQSLNMADGQVKTTAAAGIFAIVLPDVTIGDFTYKFSPSLAPVPCISTDLAGNEFYNYIMTIVTKANKTSIRGSLEIAKTVETFDMSLGSQEFVYSVRAVAVQDGIDFNAGDVVYQNVVAIPFAAAGTNTVSIDGAFPAGCDVTVTEIYSGSSYELASGAPTRTVEFRADDLQKSVSFVNQLDGSRIVGGGIDNAFTKGDSGWEMNPTPSQVNG